MKIDLMFDRSEQFIPNDDNPVYLVYMRAYRAPHWLFKRFSRWVPMTVPNYFYEPAMPEILVVDLRTINKLDLVIGASNPHLENMRVNGLNEDSPLWKRLKGVVKECYSFTINE